MWTDRIGQERSVVGGGTANQSESRHHDVTQTGRNMSLGTERKWRERVMPLAGGPGSKSPYGQCRHTKKKEVEH